jgi:RimJ/RimL family protein N-acetyltransferase
MLYQIHRYPADLIDVLHLPGDQRVIVRPVLPQDEAVTGAFFHDLRASSRYDRFLGPMRTLPPGLLAHLTHVDYSDHLALVAEVFVDGRETVIAEARYARGADKTSAEFAVSVADAWQGKGLARLLLGRIARHAASTGVTRFHGETLASNERLLRLARKAGFTLRPSPDVAGLVLLEKLLTPPPSKRDGASAPSASRPAA